jgi:hypothetical protein
MSPAGQQILEHLRIVERLREAHAMDAARAERVRVIKAYQARRFERTYADLLNQPRYGPAARFFLDELYGPQEFAARDAQFARIVPPLVRLFPDEIVQTVAQLAELHALSEDLDDTMACGLPGPAVDRRLYIARWQEAGRAPDRSRQIELTIRIGQSLDRYTRNPVLSGALRMMRRPAQSAGLGELQRFLERGFETFKAISGADEFLAIVSQREQQLIAALFAFDVTQATGSSTASFGVDPGPLGQLP